MQVYRDYIQALEKRVSTHDIDCQIADDGMTEQSHKDDCDINNIVKRIAAGQPIDPFQARTNGVYGDFTKYRDYQKNLNTIIQADEAFASLSAEIRKRFDNDPAELMKFLDNKSNMEEAIKLGLIDPPKPPPPPQKVEVVPPKEK